jgi:hypothetical protein
MIAPGRLLGIRSHRCAHDDGPERNVVGGDQGGQALGPDLGEVHGFSISSRRSIHRRA